MRSPVLIFLLYLTLALLAYLPGPPVTVFDETYHWICTCNRDFWGSLAERYVVSHSPHWFSNTIFCALSVLFGTREIPWTLTSLLLHAVNAWLCFMLVRKVTGRSQEAMWGGLLFLLSPYHAVAIHWHMVLRYLLAAMFVLVGLNYFVRRRERPGFPWYLHLFFLPALFSHEVSAAFPFLCAGVYLYLERKLTPAFFLKVSLPQMALLAAYLVISKLQFGAWIGHYGPEAHLRFIPYELLLNGLAYLERYLLFPRYFETTAWVSVVHAVSGTSETLWAEKGISVLVPLAALAAGTLLALRFIRRADPGGFRILLLLFALALSSLLPVLNLGRAFISSFQSDRYGYLAAAFQLPLLVIMICSCLKRYAPVLLSVFAAFFFWMLLQTREVYSTGSDISRRLLTTLPAVPPGDNLLILNAPDNYRGVPMLWTSLKPPSACLWEGGEPVSLAVVAYSSMSDTNDSVQVTVENDSTLLVALPGKNRRWFHPVTWLPYERRLNEYRYEGPGYEALFYYSADTSWYRLRWRGNPKIIWQAGSEWRIFVLPGGSKLPDKAGISHPAPH